MNPGAIARRKTDNGGARARTDMSSSAIVLAFSPSPILRRPCFVRSAYSVMLTTTPAPTVLPPSRMAKRCFSSMAMGVISSTSMVALSPGMIISVPAGSVHCPVTSVVRK